MLLKIVVDTCHEGHGKKSNECPLTIEKVDQNPRTQWEVESRAYGNVPFSIPRDELVFGEVDEGIPDKVGEKNDQEYLNKNLETT